jgi:3-hydroxyacyl-CoA dehydrogenase
MKVRTVGVVGGGIMGAGIAYSIASKTDCRVVLREVAADALAAAKQRFDGMLQRAAKKGTPAELTDKWASRMQYTTELDAFSQADMVVEAVFENLELKRKVFAELDRIVPAPRLLCTNTSGISISMIAGVTFSTRCP